MNIFAAAKQPDEGGAVGLNAAVQQYWEEEPCGTSDFVVGGAEPGTREWFEGVERHRYAEEPHIFAAAQFTRWAGKKLLEIGVGAGSDHLQFARAGALCHGVDLTEAAVETTRRHLALHGLSSALQRTDAEHLPFPAQNFEVVYSWGVIHHSERPEAIVEEIHRVLQPGGTFVGMMYARHSLVTYKLWVRRALLAGKPARSLRDVLWHHMESVGTKAYTKAELREMFGRFSRVEVRTVATVYDRKWLGPLAALVPDALGWNVVVRAVK
jgi:ubiquinone/menaquinone biosynthesis C-methylase UbiE